MNYRFGHLVQTHEIKVVFALAVLSCVAYSNVFSVHDSNIIIFVLSVCKDKVNFGFTEKNGPSQWFSVFTACLAPVLFLCRKQGQDGCWHMQCKTELVTDLCPSLSLLQFNRKDRIRALEITKGCKLALECLCKPSGVPSYNRQNFHPKDLNLDCEVLYRCLILYLCTQYFFLHLEPIYWHVYSYIFRQGNFSCNRVCFIFMDIRCVALLSVRDCRN